MNPSLTANVRPTAGNDKEALSVYWEVQIPASEMTIGTLTLSKVRFTKTAGMPRPYLLTVELDITG